MRKRSLYQCYNCHVQGDKLVCIKEHKLGRNGTINIRQLERGDALEFAVCQDCKDFDSMGEALSKKERGWRVVK